ncbi:hypothetical protein GCM10007924_21050 [Sneathiella chinensis]|uniref:Uncharacterized protein n=2 Tax=Sneathiella chinensis TaxID=349750 RepID=A0ABQ5U4P6_9PROT|nr:hypothetical protein GCM10007924_21050 [Sneathiella chinensis]
MLREGTLPAATGSRTSIILTSLALNVLALALPVMILQVYDRILPNNATQTLLLLVVGVGIALLLEAFFRLARSYLTAYSGARFEHIAGCRALSRTLGTNIVRFEKEAAGVYLHRFNAIENLREFMSGHNLLIFIDLPFALIFLAMVAYIGGVLVLAPALLLLGFALVTLLVSRDLKKGLEERATWDDRRYNFLIEVLTGIHTVKSLALEAQMVRRYERLQETTANVIRNVSLQHNLAQGLGTSFSQLTLIAVASFGAFLVIDERLTIGGLAACTLLSGRALQPLLRAMGVWTHYQNVKLSKERVQSLLSLPQEVANSSTPETSLAPGSPVPSPLLPRPANGGTIDFENLSFGYGDQHDDLFDTLNGAFPAGSITAITGGNGAGKTSLLWLARGLLTPTAGRVLLNGQDVSHLPHALLSERIAYLPQTATIFNGTIMDNLTAFRKGPFIDAALELSRQLGLDEVIKHLPLGYDTVIGDGAADSTPGGIRQRITIARALISNPEVILFDEANTSLDAAGDEILKNVLLDRKGKSTIILVSHRPSLLKIADRGYRIMDRQLVKSPIDALIPGKVAPDTQEKQVKLV